MATTMVTINVPHDKVQDTLEEAQSILWNQTLCFIKSMSLKCVVELHIPDAIHRHGMPATISDLLSSLSIPETKSHPLRILSQEGIFKSHITLSGEVAFDLTHVSRLLLTTTSFPQSPNFSPLILLSLNHHVIDAHHQLSHWFYEQGMTTMPFAMACGKTIWDLTEELPEFNDLFNTAMESDSELVSKVMTNIEGRCFRRLGQSYSCVSRSISNRIHFIGGNMFVEVQPADVILLKWILHDWNDEDCVKILQRCKEAIPPKEKGGKVIIIDMVVGVGLNTQTSLETQLLFDVQMMTMFHY